MADATCVVDDCTSPQKVKKVGLCGKHYQRLRKTGTTDPQSKPVRVDRECSIDECSGTVVAHELCTKHYQRQHLHGSTDKPPRGRADCSFDGCNRPHRALGWCAVHYGSFKKYGTPTRPLPEAKSCSVEGCSRKFKGNGFCEMHLRRFLKGKPLDAPIRGEIRECCEDGCTERAKCKGRCSKHYYDFHMRPRRAMYRENARTARQARPATALSQQRASYYQRNREHIRTQRKRQYEQAYAVDPSPWRAAKDRRRARTKRKMTAVERQVSLAYRRAIANDPCRYCAAVKASVVDHYFPLAKGGTDQWFNLVSACADCNASKHAKCGTRFALMRGSAVLARIFPSYELVA